MTAYNSKFNSNGTRATIICFLIAISGCMNQSAGFKSATDALSKTTPTATIGTVFSAHTKSKTNSTKIIVLIEGDGASWTRGGTLPPKNPTPRQSMLIDFFSAENGLSANQIYLGRPCQFIEPKRFRDCDISDWTSHRYAKKQTERIFAALLYWLNKLEQSSSIHLIGHSGGGLMAVRLAFELRQTDFQVNSITAISSPIDPEYWTENRGFSPLQIDSYSEELNWAVQHQCIDLWIGKDDWLISLEDIRPTIRKKMANKIRVIPKASHSKGWQQEWTKEILPTILGSSLRCGKKGDE
jgi:pimeloyl-ACP methyl ester carboxylesterase